jgi:hypothetical protein
VKTKVNLFLYKFYVILSYGKTRQILFFKNETLEIGKKKMVARVNFSSEWFSDKTGYCG